MIDKTMLRLLRDEKKEILSMKENINKLEAKNIEKIKDCVSEEYWDITKKPKPLMDFLGIKSSMDKYVHPKKFKIKCDSCGGVFEFEAKSRSAFERKCKCTLCSNLSISNLIDSIKRGDHC
jgi:hypothetical protein